MPFLNPKRLVLATRALPGVRDDAFAIAREVVRLAPHVRTTLACPRDTMQTLPIAWDIPAVTVGLGTGLGRLVPPRGAVFQNQPLKKLDQFSRLKSADIATPRTMALRPGARFDPAGWEEFVIVKPLSLTLTSKGNSVKLFRAKTLAQVDVAKLPADHILRAGPVLVQDFINTGLYPNKWRVLTLFGEPLYSSFSRSILPRTELNADDDAIETSTVEPRTTANVEADVEGERDSLIVDPGVLMFAKGVHQVFPRLPLLGIDILRREADGRLFALEINAGGNVWHFSSFAEKHRARLGGKQKMIDQFGAWTSAARALIRVVEQTAC